MLYFSILYTTFSQKNTKPLNLQEKVCNSHTTVYYQDAQTSYFRTAHLWRGKSPIDESKLGRISISVSFLLQVSCSLPPSPTQLYFPITVIKKGGHIPMECFFCLKLPYQKFVLFLKKDVTFIATKLLCTSAIFCKSDTKCFYISYCW